MEEFTIIENDEEIKPSQVTITLTNGEVLPDVKINGSFFYVEKVLDKTIFDDNLTKIIIKIDEDAYEKRNQILKEFIQEDNKTFFIFDSEDPLIKKINELEALVKYNSMINNFDNENNIEESEMEEDEDNGDVIREEAQ